MPTTFTVMTWNVENLFPPGYPISPRRVVSQADYDAKLAYLARLIGAIAPDVLALQEIGSQSRDDTRSIDDLQNRLNGQYPFKALSSYPDSRGIRVGFLSRLAIEQTDDLIALAPGELAGVPDWFPRPPLTRMGRGALRIDVVPTADVRVRLLTVHLKSKLVSYPPGRGGQPRFAPADEDERNRGAGLGLLRRAAESVAVRGYLNYLMRPGDATHTIVLGDLNDEPRAATSQLLLGP